MSLRSPWLVVLALSFASPAHADWPMQRHDVGRSATGSSTSRVDAPAIVFRHYLGGALGALQLDTYDVDADGAREIVMVVGGAVVAKTQDDVVVWETGALDVFRLDAIADLDGAGGDEIVVSAAGGRVHVLDAATGARVWSSPVGEIGVTGAVRLADLDGDGQPDLYVADNACGSTGSLGDVAVAYSFGASLSSPTRLFQLERGRRDYVCGGQDSLVDVDGDGQLDVLIEGNHFFYVYSGVDGMLRSTSADLGSLPYGSAPLQFANLDADPAMEVVAYTNNSYDPSINSRRVLVLDWNEATSRHEILWQRSVVDLAGDAHGYGTGGLADLDGDGRLEIATSFCTGAGASWTTFVLDALTGSELAQVSRGPFVGLVDLDADGRSELLSGDRDAGIGVYRFAAGTLTTVFVAPGIQPLTARARDATHASSMVLEPLTLDVDRMGGRELVGVSYAAATPALVALSAATDPPTVVASLPLEGGITVLMARASAPVTRTYAQLLLARSDGYLWILDGALHPTNAQTTGEFASRGLRIGGFYSGPNGIRPAPLAADLDGMAGDELLVRTSRGVLQRLSPRDATLVQPPDVDWEVASGHAAIVELDGTAPPEIVHWTSDPSAVLRAIRAVDAAPLWSRTLGTSAIVPTNDLMPGDVSGDGTPDVVFSLYTTTVGTVRINALDGRSGAPLWPADFETLVAGSGLGHGSLADREGDGVLDVLAAPRNLLWWVDGQDGTAGASVDAGYPNYGLVANLDADPAPEIMAAGTVYDVRSFELDLSERWRSAGTLHTRVDGVVATCPTIGAVFVTGHNASPRLSAYRVSTGEIVGDIALRAGASYEPPTTAPDGPGQLGELTVSTNLTGSGRPGVLVPSTDGYLYAIDPCGMRIEWALDLRYPVGEAVLADTDGDGEDEIVVTAADGFLYGIDREVIPRPTFVYENDGMGAALTAAEDVDDFITADTLHANWASVDGATAYEYAVLTPEGSFVTAGPFVNVGTATSADPSGLPLLSGRRYLFAVRAIGPMGSSSEALSDGVVVRADPCDACLVGQICVNEACLPDPCSGVMCPPGQTCMDAVCVGTIADTGVTIDAGVRDGGGGPGPGGGGGCCSVAGRRDGTSAIVLALGLVAALARRRR